MRPDLILLPTTAAVAVLVARAASLPVAVLLAVLLGGVVAAILRLLERRRVLALATRINGWVGAEAHEPVDMGEASPWRELAVALNALGAEHHRRGERLRREWPWRRRLVDALVGPALLLSADEDLVVANAEARRLLSLPDDVGAGFPLSRLLGSAALAEGVRHARRVGHPVPVEAAVGGRSLRVTAAAVDHETLVMLEDRTDQQRVEDVRRDFVVNASHELKTPATSVQALAEALAVTLPGDPERAAKLVDRLGQEAERLVRMVHDLLDLRRLEDATPMARTAVDLVHVVGEVLEELRGEADRRGVGLDVDLPARADLAAVPSDLRLIVQNLVANAIQYSDEGDRVTVAVSRHGSAHRLEVADTGVGIPAEDLDRVFERFYRVDVDRSRRRGGTGLGLSIVRHAVQRHGGRITVESLLGEGTTFRVELPVSAER